MGYRKGLVYFIDVLGTKERSFEENLFIAETFKDEMSKVQKRHRETSVVDRAVFSFSDCAYIVYALKDEFFNYENENKFIFQSLYNTTYTLSTFLYNGFLCRGGIAYGDLYFDVDKQVIFGPAINCAYKIEREVGYPMIALDDSLATQINDFDSSVKLANPMAAATNGKIILYDKHKQKYFLNYLNYLCNVGSAGLGKVATSFEEVYKIALDNSQKQIECHIDDDKIVEKHKWQIEYLNRVKEMRDSEVEINPIDLLNMINNK